MDPRDRPLLFPDGAACTVCGASVPTGRIRVLARRDDVAFLSADVEAVRDDLAAWHGDFVGWLDR